ncbi:hypothetical protein PMIT1313_02409 [Prochlorococcus marinus str. MIT 1313]|nr:hypothetical protein PMIT1313_02409 [Prochlorococcus marinus str. MIT 1313]KZR70977.1 hypothetical protein PMIT1318_02119 [Prochlorococcus marinus str. MIT 1318]
MNEPLMKKICPGKPIKQAMNSSQEPDISMAPEQRGALHYKAQEPIEILGLCSEMREAASAHSTGSSVGQSEVISSAS